MKPERRRSLIVGMILGAISGMGLGGAAAGNVLGVIIGGPVGMVLFTALDLLLYREGTDE